MKFKIGDKVMLKAVPYDDWNLRLAAEKVFTTNINKQMKITDIGEKGAWVDCDRLHMLVSLKYLKHAVKPKAVKYTIDCGSRLNCKRCDYDENICKFTGTKSQVEAHIKKYWKQPKIKAVGK